MTALANDQQLQQVIQTQVNATMLAFYDQQALQQQQQAAEAEAAAQPPRSPELQKQIDRETELINAVIRGNAALNKRFGEFDLDDAIKGDGGPALQQLAHRIDDHVTKLAGSSGTDTPLSDQRAVSKAVAEGSRQYASLDMTSVEDATSFSTDVAAGSQSPDSSEGEGDGDPFDYEREGDQPAGGFGDIDDKVVAAHYRESMEGSGHQFETRTPTIAEMAPAAGQEPEGFYGD